MLLPIGKFARASRLSIKSLRNYDQSGLLPAAFVDPESGYRYYRIEQLARADAIRSLRIVDMPLSKIAETLATDDPDSVLMSHLEALETQRDELVQKAQLLKRRINLKEYVMTTEVTIKTNSAIVAASHRVETTYPTIFEDIPAGLGTVMGALGAAQVDPIGAPFTLYYQAPDADTSGDIAMCIPIAAPGSFEASDANVEIVEVPAGAAAAIIHEGSYDDMGESYAAVATWIQERGHTITGPAREVYLNSPAEVDEADLRTELLFPIDAEGQF